MGGGEGLGPKFSKTVFWDNSWPNFVAYIPKMGILGILDTEGFILKS